MGKLALCYFLVGVIIGSLLIYISFLGGWYMQLSSKEYSNFCGKACFGVYSHLLVRFDGCLTEITSLLFTVKVFMPCYIITS